MDLQVMLDPADLLRWDGWSLQARQYIEASGKSVDLGSTASIYTDEIIAVDRWVAELACAPRPLASEAVVTEDEPHRPAESVASRKVRSIVGLAGGATLLPDRVGMSSIQRTVTVTSRVAAGLAPAPDLLEQTRPKLTTRTDCFRRGYEFIWLPMLQTL
jgi:hypothetical protein